jgi:hypothetical protein
MLNMDFVELLKGHAELGTEILRAVGKRQSEGEEKDAAVYVLTPTKGKINR